MTHLIWPELAFPFILSRDPDAFEADRRSPARQTRADHRRGAAWKRLPADPGARPRYFNAIQVIGPAAAPSLDPYDKAHLVPFGEYLPFDDRAASARHPRSSSTFPAGSTPGERIVLLHVPGLPPVAPLDLLRGDLLGRGRAAGRSADPAGVILNVTNDGWFGRTTGPYQHFAQARLRPSSRPCR